MMDDATARRLMEAYGDPHSRASRLVVGAIPPPIMRQLLKLPKSDPHRFLAFYGHGVRCQRQQIQRAILMDPPRRWDEQWDTRTL
jgi:hypothetical protein